MLHKLENIWECKEKVFQELTDLVCSFMEKEEKMMLVS